MRRHLRLLFAFCAATACTSVDNQIKLIELQVTDIDLSVAFYQGVFGWEVNRIHSSYVVLEATPVAIGLTLTDSVLTGRSAFVVGVRDLDLILERVGVHGGRIRQSISPSFQGRSFRFLDPDGHEAVVWSAVNGPGDAEGS